jgi:DNA-binding NtrC family response regulator
MLTYQWPGNVRELERLMERALTLAQSETIELDDLPPTVRGDYALAVVPSLQRNESLRAWGSRYVRLILDRAQGNKREACRVLGISYHTLQAYLRFPIDDPAAAAEWDPGRPDEIAEGADGSACSGGVCGENVDAPV